MRTLSQQSKFISRTFQSVSNALQSPSLARPPQFVSLFEVEFNNPLTAGVRALLHSRLFSGLQADSALATDTLDSIRSPALILAYGDFISCDARRRQQEQGAAFCGSSDERIVCSSPKPGPVKPTTPGASAPNRSVRRTLLPSTAPVRSSRTTRIVSAQLHQPLRIPHMSQWLQYRR